MVGFDEVGYREAVTRLRGLFDAQYMPTLKQFASIASAELSLDEQAEFSTLEWPRSNSEDPREPRFRHITHGLDMNELAYRFGTYLPMLEEDGPNKGRLNYKVVRRHVSVELLPLRQAFRISVFVFEDRGGLGDADRHALAYIVYPILLGENAGMSKEAFERALAHLWSTAVYTKRESLMSQNYGDWRIPVVVKF